MLRKLLFELSQNLEGRYIDHGDEPYLERFLVGTIFGRRIYLHRFVASDPLGIHDHPFLHSWSLILAGWYLEERWALRYVRRFFNRIGPNDFHRVVLPDNGRDVWTLFWHTARVKPWGVMRAVRAGAHGPEYEYIPLSDPEDPEFSQFKKKSRLGKDLRAERLIPCGKNAYAMGLAKPVHDEFEIEKPFA
jgi:hypothetical protein